MARPSSNLRLSGVEIFVLTTRSWNLFRAPSAPAPPSGQFPQISRQKLQSPKCFRPVRVQPGQSGSSYRPEPGSCDKAASVFPRTEGQRKKTTVFPASDRLTILNKLVYFHRRSTVTEPIKRLKLLPRGLTVDRRTQIQPSPFREM